LARVVGGGGDRDARGARRDGRAAGTDIDR
jgi:hypothetical protein